MAVSLPPGLLTLTPLAGSHQALQVAKILEYSTSYWYLMLQAS